MAREKGTGSLQREKSGRWTLRVGVNGRRYSRSTGTTDRAKAERCLERFLSPLGLGVKKLPLADAWLEYIKSPCRRELAPSTMNAKRLIWMGFARWMEQNHLEVSELTDVSYEHIAEYLSCIRLDVCASTYNSRICVLREMFRALSERAGVVEDPWRSVRLRADDSHSRRELTLDELDRLMEAAEKAGPEWRMLFMVGIYTGLRLGDCCRLSWRDIDLVRGIIQKIPAKTRKHAHGRPVTIPIHPQLSAALNAIPMCDSGGFVMQSLAALYGSARWKISYGLGKIFKAAGIMTSIRIEGRRTRTPEATFHSLRHTFVSFAANAGVPLPIVQSIVGHGSTAMTRHYYHESETELRRAVAAIPSIGAKPKP